MIIIIYIKIFKLGSFTCYSEPWFKNSTKCDITLHINVNRWNKVKSVYKNWRKSTNNIRE